MSIFKEKSKKMHRCIKPLIIFAGILAMTAFSGTAARAASAETGGSETEFSIKTSGKSNVNTGEEKRIQNISNIMTLKYDDRYTFSHRVRRVSNLSVNSRNAVTGKRDRYAVRLVKGSRNKIIACGCGRARVRLVNGDEYDIRVTRANISLILMIGQSNMEGSAAIKPMNAVYRAQSFVNEEGKVYNTYAPSNDTHSAFTGGFEDRPFLTSDNADQFVPDSLTDNTGEKWQRTNNLTNAPGAEGKIGVDSALAYEWNKKLNEKIWLVNAAHSGSSINSWLPDGSRNNFREAVNLYRKCEKVLQREIEAGHYKLRHKGYFWMQGEQDYSMSMGDYLKKFTSMHEALKKELAGKGMGPLKHHLEFAGICMIRAHEDPMSKEDLYMTGPRRAQYYMTESHTDKYRDVFLVTQLSDVWTSDATVKKYFKKKYGNYENYRKTLRMRKGQIPDRMPSKISDVHEVIHYSQIAYNEMGRDIAMNTIYALKYKNRPDKDYLRIKIVSEDGVTDISNYDASEISTDMLFIPKVYPTWRTKEINTSYKSSNISYSSQHITFLKKPSAEDRKAEDFDPEDYVIKFRCGDRYRRYSPYLKKLGLKATGSEKADKKAAAKRSASKKRD